MLCNNITNGSQYDCANPWGEGCTTDGIFQFTTLWNVTSNIFKACANDTRLYGNPITHDDPSPTFAAVSLTEEACQAIVGPGWTWYPEADIFARMTAWRFPLFQLVATFPRPPLSFNVNLFVLLHLLGDPIDTIRNLLIKLTECEQRALFWRHEFEFPLRSLVSSSREDRDWKAVAIIAEAYNEWNEADTADDVMRRILGDLTEQRSQKETMSIIRYAAELLAADRATNFLPIIAAQVIFISAIAVAFAKTAASPNADSPSPTVFKNVEAHSIAFSAQFFWIIPAVIMASVIGVSQTEHAIPRILERLQEDLDRVFPSKFKLPNDYIHDKIGRVVKGGIYSWQPADGLGPSHPTTTTTYAGPDVFEDTHTQSYKSVPQVLVNSSPMAPTTPVSHLMPTSPTQARQRIYSFNNKNFMSPRLFSMLVVLTGTATAILTSFLVPPEGFNCRHIAQLLITVVWLLSTLTNIVFQYLVPVQHGRHKLRFWFTFCKDLFSTFATVGGVMYAHVGIFNRCSCYTNWGRTGLALPAMPHVQDVLAWRIRRTYPAIIFSGIIFQLVFVPVFVLVQNRHAVRVFLQRDHGDSSARWLWKVTSSVQRIWPQSSGMPRLGGGLRVPSTSTRGDISVGGGRRRPHPFQRLDTDEISLVDYTSRSKMRRAS